MIGVIDYGSGNVAAISNLLREAQIPHTVSCERSELREADRYILPGVGAFDPTMQKLEETGLADLLENEVRRSGKFLMGICVGMHLLADTSEEGSRQGLGWIPGCVRRIKTGKLDVPPHLPHMGWNAIKPVGAPPIFSGLDFGRGCYFLHSYFFEAAAEDAVCAYVTYGDDFPCVVAKDNVIGVQFHPEKSHGNGARLFKNFAAL